jgi:hypothetical protein
MPIILGQHGTQDRYHAGNRGYPMATANPMCPTCSRPIVLAAPGAPRYADMAHLKCQEAPPSVNTWPGGIRQLFCLSCGRGFDSASKAQRLCRACRSRSGLKTV